MKYSGSKTNTYQDNKNSETNNSSKRKRHVGDVTIRRRGTRWNAFHCDKLNFGVHGLLGVLALVTTVATCVLLDDQEQAQQQQHSRAVVVVAVLLTSQCVNTLLVHHAVTLLSQVPKETHIVANLIVAPHREAFQRTIWIVQYLVSRVVGRSLLFDKGTALSPLLDWTAWWAPIARILYYAVCGWRWYPLTPSWRRTDWWNGNTWIFVVPLCVGVTGDLYQCLVYGDLFCTRHLLMGQFLGLILAFGFTLGFRNYVPMPIVYGGAAAGVWKIIQMGITTARSS